MQCFVGGRCTGKTWSLINLSHETGFPIVARSKSIAHSIEQQAQKMGKPIPRPVCCQSIRHAAGSMFGEKVLVDEAGGVLADVLGVHVVAASIEGEALRAANPAIPDLGSMGFAELLRAWRAERKKGKRHGQGR